MTCTTCSADIPQSFVDAIENDPAISYKSTTINERNVVYDHGAYYCCGNCKPATDPNATPGNFFYKPPKDSIHYKSKRDRHLAQVGRERTKAGYYKRA